MATDGPPPKKLKKEDDDEVSKEDLETQKALEEIDACQNHIDALNEKASEDILRVEQKFNIMRKPYFEKRNLIIDKLPNFWITALMNHPQITSILDDEEEDCLQYLAKLEVEEFDDIKFGYKINFYFDPNPYFENHVLSKEFHVGSPEPNSKHIAIRWKEGHDIVKVIIERGMHESGNIRNADPKTFFTWYEEDCDPTNNEIAEIIKDDLWPNPLQYYLVPDIDVDTNDEDDDMSEDDDGSVVYVHEIDEVIEDEDEDGDYDEQGIVLADYENDDDEDDEAEEENY